MNILAEKNKVTFSKVRKIIKMKNHIDTKCLNGSVKK